MSESRKENQPRNMWQILEAISLRLDARISELENRIDRSNAQSKLLDEKLVVEKEKLLGGRSISTSPSGSIERVRRLPVCDICGHSLKPDEEFTICLSCGKKLDSKCSISYENRIFCFECLRAKVPLTKRSYKVLLAVANEITSIASISDMSRMEKKDVRASIAELLDLNLMVKKGISIFSTLHMTDKGLEALAAYRQVYTDEDVLQFETDVQKNLPDQQKVISWNSES